MHAAFFTYLSNFIAEPISEMEKQLIEAAFTPHKLRKRQYFLQEGEHCKQFAFIVKGAMRQYSIDEKGVEHVVRLGIENWWMGDRESWVMDRPSIYNIDAWEDCHLLLITRTNMLSLIKQVPAFVEMTRQLDDRNNIANQRRLTSSISGDAEQKYDDFLTCYPGLAARFPQHVIASYLGITKDTLSRIKRQTNRKP